MLGKREKIYYLQTSHLSSSHVIERKHFWRMEIFRLIKKKNKFRMYHQNSLTTDPQAFQGIMSSPILRGITKTS